MAVRGRFLGAAAAVALFAACDGGVALPGLSEPPASPAAPGAPPAPPLEPVEQPGPQPATPPETPDEIEGPEPESPPVGIDPPGEPPVPGTVDPETPVDAPSSEPETPATVPPEPAGPEPAEPGTTEPVTPDPPAGDPEPATPEPQPSPPPPPPVPPAAEPAFSYHAPGNLIPGSGRGSPETITYAPDMVFPIQNAPAYPQSMVWRFGGGIGGGDECDPRNYEYPWRDNFCETRSSNFSTPTCPVPKVHLGQDIRVGDAAGCNAMRQEYRTTPAGITRYRVVAAEDGVISNIGSYTVTLRAGPRIYRYLHLNMRALQVSVGDTVTAGQHLGYVSKDFGGTATTFHLHFEIKQNTPDGAWIFVPPYTSLVESYARRENAPGELVAQNVGIAEAPIPVPEGFVITE